MIKCFVAIDYSINFPAICIYKDDKYEFISLMRKKEVKGKTKRCYEFLKTLDDFKFIETENMNSESEYSDSQTDRIIDAGNIANNVLNILLEKNLNPDETIIAIEGFSYASTGNRLAEIAGYAFILRYLLHLSGFTIEIFAPSTIKKYAGKGNFKKSDMMNKFFENDILEPALNKKLLENKELLEHKNNPNKPFEDIVDVYWICQTIKNKYN